MNGKTIFIHGLISRIKPYMVLSVMAVILFTMVSPSLAQVTDISISPENPDSGDTITITGKADPNEEVPITISFGSSADVTDGEYVYDIGKITIPDGSESFKVKAEGVETLKLSVSILGIPISLPDKLISYSGDVASFGTGQIHSGTYDITLSGTSSSDEVDFSFDASGTITADENGNIEYSYTTDNMPDGDYTINIGGQSEKITIGSDSSSSSSGSSTKSHSSKTGTEYNIVPADSVGSSTDNSSGVGDDTSSDISDSQAADNSLDSTQDAQVQQGYIMTNQSSSSDDKLPVVGIAGVIVGIFCIVAIFIGYRKNKYK